MNLPLVVAMTGASGAVYARRLLEVLLESQHPVHLTISPSARIVYREELGIELDLDRFEAGQLQLRIDEQHWAALSYHHYTDYMCSIASGSFLTAGMVICPCSGGTLSAVVHGSSTNLVQRAADVHLKERRKLVLVTRETPLSIVQIENMKKAWEAGAVVLPASPGWYHGVQKLEDLVDFIVARILDQLGIDHQLMRRWGEASS